MFSEKESNTVTDLRPTRLDDVYTLDEGTVFITGTQALTRLPLLQRQRDRASGLDTRGFISGYRGSPLAGYDLTLARASRFLEQHQVTFMPAINEELAATAIVGTQQVAVQPDATCDGVFSLWYGKGPGLDRATDALKHANSIGTTQHGGVLVVVGDDHNAVSSAMAHQSEQLLAAMMMPVLAPSNLGEILDYGLLGWAMSRFSGCYTGLKLESETIESASSVDFRQNHPAIILPEFEFPPDGIHHRWPDAQLDAEARLHQFKLPAASAFARANSVDRVVMGDKNARFGIVTTGKACLAVRQALEDLGIDETRARETGLSVYKVGLSWPLDMEGARQFSAGLEEVLVIEEKRSFVESQFMEALYQQPDALRPRVVGKEDEKGRPLLPSAGILATDLIAQVIAGRWPDVAPENRARDYFALIEQQNDLSTLAANPRSPFFCSGCPHNRSTVPPKGSRVLAGTGCHLMAVFMDRDTSGFLHMGAEGANWPGQAPFCKTNHIFQNLGDGTYTHSGSLAIRQSIAAGFNITYKILYNDAVAMTGGQPVDGSFTVPQMTRQLHAEGVMRVVVVADEPDKYDSTAEFAPGVTIHHRNDLAAVEQELAGVSGVSVLIYDQICAAEKRRRKRRSKSRNNGQQAVETRVMINEAVCEGCGDCVLQSNCISVAPRQTPFGIKRQIDQSACNTDMSCVEGFCPSFVTITGGKPVMLATDRSARLQRAVEQLPEPATSSIGRTFNMIITGVGGQGVITLGRITGMAAHLQGLRSSVLDFPGLAQKGGGVMSYVRIAPEADDIHVPRVPLGTADLLMAGDIVTALGEETARRIRKNATRAIVNSHVSPTAANVLDPHSMIDSNQLAKGLADMVGDSLCSFINATDISERLAGDAITANIFLLGYACQAGALPINIKALSRAIELNGAGAETNLSCFSYGRLAAHDPELVAEMAGLDGAEKDSMPVSPENTSLEEVIAVRERHLVNYQSKTYARRYMALVEKARASELGIDSENESFTRAIAMGLFHVMAYKDEYEIARLLTSNDFMQQVRTQFSGDFKITHHLAPPLLARRNRETGKISKMTFGPWIRPVLTVLARFRFLRGTPLDIFGYTRERRQERARIVEYERMANELCSSLSPGNLEVAAEKAARVLKIRGYGHIKERNVEAVANLP
jgi:indolepyruvate ferredoxin oxidoreductase